MSINVRDLISGKVVLARRYPDVLLPGHKDVRAKGEVFEVVSDGVFGSAAVTAAVVERRVDRDEPELAFVEVVPVDPEVIVLGEGQMGRELMRETGVPSVVGFAKRRSMAAPAGADSHCGARKEFENAGGNILEIGDLEVSREACVQGRI